MQQPDDKNINDDDLEDLYNWVDEVPLSRQKKSISRDFADGVLVAEIVKHFCPRVVELHNYAEAHSKQRRKENWKWLNEKVFKKLGFELADDVVMKVINAEPFAIEQVLMLLRRKIDRYLYERKRQKEESNKQCVFGPGGTPGITTAASAASSKVQERRVSDKPEADQNLRVPTLESGPTTDEVPKLVVEEKQQEVLAKEETIQILQAKIRRLEHLVHLKDIRIDDLSNTIKEMEEDNRRYKITAPRNSQFT